MPTALKVQFITAIRLWKTPWTFEDEEEEEEFSREIIRDTTARLKILTFNLTVENLRLMVKVVNFAMLGSQGSSLVESQFRRLRCPVLTFFLKLPAAAHSFLLRKRTPVRDQRPSADPRSHRRDIWESAGLALSGGAPKLRCHGFLRLPCSRLFSSVRRMHGLSHVRLYKPL